jgi:hypothetical protein
MEMRVSGGMRNDMMSARMTPNTSSTKPCDRFSRRSPDDRVALADSFLAAIEVHLL